MIVAETSEKLGLEEEEAVELLVLFVEVSADDLKQLCSSMENMLPESAVVAAHSIRGAARNLGLEDIYGIAKEIEDNARGNNLEGGARLTQSLAAMIAQVATELDRASSI